MKAAQLLMLAALVPAAANPALLERAGVFELAVCSAKGANTPGVSLPGKPVLPGSNATLCCAKGCHTSADRKKGKRAY